MSAHEPPSFFTWLERRFSRLLHTLSQSSVMLGSAMKQMTVSPSLRRPTIPASTSDWTWRETFAWVRPVASTISVMFFSPSSRVRRIFRRLGSASVRNHEAIKASASSVTGGRDFFRAAGMMSKRVCRQRLYAYRLIQLNKGTP